MDLDVFIEKWRRSTRTEKSAAQEHFLDLCELLGVQKPSEVDPHGEFFTFEKHITRADGSTGYADVWRKDRFAWEYKRSYDNGEVNHKNLVKAHAQLKQYADALGNPPLLIVSDMKEIRVHTNFTNTIAEQHRFELNDIIAPETRRKLTWCFTDPEKLRPQITREGVTQKAAMALGAIAAKLRTRHEPRRVAHFLNRLVFCMFAEDIGLLPDNVFADILEEGQNDEKRFAVMLADLFAAMKERNGRFGFLQIPWFNGGLFDDNDVLPLSFYDVRNLGAAARLDWSAIEPAIFGALFESGLNPDKRKQMASLFDSYGIDEDKPDALPGILAAPQADKGVGIHYTDPTTIMKIVDPVVLEPLRREWEEAKVKIKNERKLQSSSQKGEKAARALYLKFRERLGSFRVLDPACGSGNFLYLALQHLKDFDLQVMTEAKTLDLPLDDQRVGPNCVRGIEVNPYAAELARVTIWIGELQWQLRNAFGIKRAPILSSLDGIVNKDALINSDGTEASWPEANAVIGNPPFLGNKRMISNLGEQYTQRVRNAFAGRVPGGADFVTYWLEKAAALVEAGKLETAGLVATNSIRGGPSRNVIDRIVATTRIFEAWSDESWILDGAAVRVSLVCFCAQNESGQSRLNGIPVAQIFSDLTGKSGNSIVIDLTKSKQLSENRALSFMGVTKSGPFDIGDDLARDWLKLPANPNGLRNNFVLKSSANGNSITKRKEDRWIIDFSACADEAAASLFEAPFEYARQVVKPFRDLSRQESNRKFWWRFERPRPEMWSKLNSLSRYIATAMVAKHRLFVWMPVSTVPENLVIVIARDDDTTFGILHSRFHECWALRMGTSLEDRPRYTPSTTFETFPFPRGLTPNVLATNYADDPRAQAIATAAKRLNELRENWLNPPDLVRREPEVVAGYPERLLPVSKKAQQELKKRTLTSLYNARPAWLDNAHKELDAAVAAAYGWPIDLAEDDILARLFALNQERATAESQPN